MHLFEHVDPVLRWAGGKRWLLPTIKTILNNIKINNYHEPFLGGGAIFLGIRHVKNSFISDINPDLIEVYECIQNNPDAVSRALKLHNNTSEHYYQTRKSSPDDQFERAARFIFLNHTSYNGIYRVNLQGQYNVPYGYRVKPNIPTEHTLKIVSRRLQQATICTQDFERCVENIRAGDLVFLDPPYTVAHNNNGFVKYNQKLFSWEDQCRLRALLDEIDKLNAYYILSNAAHSSIADLFDKGDRMIVTKRKNVIGGVASSRGYAAEYLFTNVGKK